MVLFSAGSNLTSYTALFVLNVITTSRPFILSPPLVMFPNALFSARYFSSCTQPFSVYAHLFHFPWPPPLCSWHLALLLLSLTQIFDSSISHLQNALQQISSWMTANLLTLNSSKTEFLFIELKNQLAKIHNFSFNASHSTRNLGFIFDEHLTFLDQITSLSKAYHYHVRQFRFIRFYFDSSTACTVATSIVYSKLDYCNSVYYRLLKSQLSRLQQIQNSLARTVVKAFKSCHITPILHTLHWLRITERVEYTLTYLQSSHSHPNSISS